MTNEHFKATPDLTSPSILLVDDEEQVVKSLKRLLRREWNVYTAMSGEEAYNLIRSTQIHVLVSDQRMPGMTGTELLYKVQKYNPDIICVLLTGYSDIQTSIDAINQNSVYRYLTKPWEAEDLSITLREAFEKHILKIEKKILLQKLQSANELLEQKVKERTQQLIEMNKYLETLNTQKNMFLSMACHDLRSPLNAIIIFSQLIRNCTDPLLENQLDKITTIYKSAKSMLNIIENFINMTVIEAGKIILDKECISIFKFLESLLIIQEAIATEKNFRIAVDIEPDLPDVYMDQQRITQVFNNLLHNAYKFAYPETIITIQVKKKSSAIAFSVINQGEPIPSAQIENIFSAFERSLHNTAKVDGVGLGLFICKEMVELHNGVISVESSSEKGTCFTFTIPIPEESESCEP